MSEALVGLSHLQARLSEGSLETEVLEDGLEAVDLGQVGHDLFISLAEPGDVGVKSPVLGFSKGRAEMFMGRLVL